MRWGVGGKEIGELRIVLIFDTMNTKKIALILLTLVSLIVINACKHDEEGCGATNISRAGESESHNNGRNCMSCHNDGGSGKGCFTAAGSVYRSNGSAFTSAVVRLYTQPNAQGELRATITGDNLGNFFTTDNINYSGGLYPTLVGSNGAVQHMPTSITSGACNSCHGASTDRLTTD